MIFVLPCLVKEDLKPFSKEFSIFVVNSHLPRKMTHSSLALISSLVKRVKRGTESLCRILQVHFSDMVIPGSDVQISHSAGWPCWWWKPLNQPGRSRERRVNVFSFFGCAVNGSRKFKKHMAKLGRVSEIGDMSASSD